MALQLVGNAGVDDHVAALLAHIEIRSAECRKHIHTLQRSQAEAASSGGLNVHVRLRSEAAVLGSQVSRLQVAAALAEAFLADAPLPGPGPNEAS
jgi:hypothetical protein